MSASIASKAIKTFSEIPGPKSFPLIGTLPYYLPLVGKYNFDRIHRTGRKKWEEYGNIVREEIIPGVNIVYLFDPSDIETLFRSDGRSPCRRSHKALEKYRLESPEHNSAGLLPTNGETWLNLRTQFQKALAKENVTRFIPQKDAAASDLTSIIRKDPSAFIRNDFLPILMGTFAEIIAKCFFGSTFGSIESIREENSLLSKVCKNAMDANAYFLKSDNGSQLWKKWDTPSYSRFKKNMGYLEDMVRLNIQRIQSETNPGENILKSWLSEEGRDPKDTLTISSDMLLAGIDTSAFSTSFILYNLAKNPPVQEKLFSELKELLPHRGSPIDQGVLTKASYLKRVIKESLRINPVSVGIGRILQEDAVFSGYFVPKNTVMVTLSQVSCRLPQYFDSPEEFIPERWAPGNRSKKNSFLNLGFGHGPRACIARRFAEQSIQIVTAKTLRNFQIEWVGKGELDSYSVPINKPDAPLLFKFTPKDD